MLLKIRDLIMRYIGVPFSKHVGGLHIPCEPLVTLASAECAKRLAETGDVVLVRKRWRMSNLLIPGYWSHVGIVNGCFVIDAIEPTVRVTPLVDFLMDYDEFAIVRPHFLSLEERAALGPVAQSRVGTPYDFEFEEGANAFYCSELVTWAIQQSWHQITSAVPWGNRDIFGMFTTVPQDFYSAKKLFTRIMERRND